MKRDSDQIFDELLVIRCREKDEEAIGLLWNRWQPRILKWSYDFLKDQELAGEIAQESWISIFKGIGQLKDPALFRFWAYRIVQRRSADYIRQQQKEREVNQELQKELKEEDESGTANHDRIEQMLRSIRALPEMQQQILRLFYMEKYSVREISVMMELPEGTVKSRLFHARQLLKQKLQEVNHE
ncbi:RNA polymerase sigma factor [Roseivirga sp.]|uniref:RNA polymerase sigma factor n=1 Tax=Roseivirga sp. TaxID=1964215 RepID=UPI003B52D440